MPNQTIMLDASQLPPLPDGPIYAPAQQPAPPGQLYGNSQRPMDGIPQFELVAVKLEDGTFKNVEYVNILTPGDNKSMPRAKVTNYHRQKYAAWYDAWRRGLEMAPEGTPIEMWPMVTPAQVREFKAKNIMTVEQLANLSDTNSQAIPMGGTFRLKAIAWLKEKTKADDIEARRRSEQLMKDNQALLENQLRSMSEEIARLNAKLAQPATPVEPPAEPAKRGPGRPPLKKPDDTGV